MKKNYSKHILSLLVFLFVAGQSFSQDFDYKVERNIKIKFSHVFDPSKVETHAAFTTVQAPKPLSNDSSAKSKKNYLKFNKPYNSRRTTENPYNDSLLRPLNPKGFLGARSAGTPNDNHMAISNDGLVVSTLNQSILCYSEDGERYKSWGLSFMTADNISDKPGGPIANLTRTYDPKVIYDPLNDRFILVFLNGTTDENSLIIVAFSQTNDPREKWNVYTLSGNPLKQINIWTDYPIIATTKEDFFVTINLLEEGKGWQDGFQQSVIWQVEKKGGYNGDTLRTNFWYDLEYQDKALWSICPVQGGMEQSDKEIYFLTVRPGDEINDSIFMHKIDNTLASGQAKYSVKQLKSNLPYGVPASAFQPKEGFRLATNDARVLSGIMHKDVIQYVQTTSAANTFNSCIYHGRIEGVGTSEKVYGNIIQKDSIEFAYPSLCYAGYGENDQSIAITFSHVSKTVNPGTSVVYVDRYGQYSSVIQVKKGDSIINSFIADTSERWGDYTSIQRRWNKQGELWAVGSFGDEDARTSTWVAQVIIKDDKVYFIHPDGQKAKAFPIPSYTNSVNVEVNAEEGVEYLFEIFDKLGKKVVTAVRSDLQNGTHLIKLNNLSVRPGLYVLKVYADGAEIGSEKIMFN